VNRSFTLVEVLISLTLLSFVTLVVLEGGSNSKSLLNTTKHRNNFYDDLTLITLAELNNEKDEVKIADLLSNFKLSDEVREHLKTKEFHYLKEVISQEEFIQLKAVRYHNESARATLFTFELAQ
jgi:competence protein ComGC